MKIQILTHSRSSIALLAVRSRTATSPLYIVHCLYCASLAGLSKSKLSFICCTKCEQEDNKDKLRSFAVFVGVSCLRHFVRPDRRNTDNVQYRVDSWQFAISPRATRLRIDYA